VARFKPTPDGLTILRAGMCPDCGASIPSGLTACRACGLELGEHARELPAGRAAPAPRAAAAGPIPTAASASSSPGLDAGTAARRATASSALSAAMPRRPTSSTDTAPHGPAWLDLDRLERLPPRSLAVSDAEGPDVVWGPKTPLLGAALARATTVMADAAVVDDPLVLLCHAPGVAHVPRAAVNLRWADAAGVDDVQALLRPPVPVAAPVPAAASPARAAAPAATVAPASPTAKPPGDAPRPLSLDDLERLERPAASTQPLSFAELPDTFVDDPRLGAALTRGANVVMADAAIVDDPLVLLGYPPAPVSIPRGAVNLQRSDSAIADDALFLLRRPPPPPPRPAPVVAAPPSSASPLGAAAPSRSSGALALSSQPTTSRPGTPTVRPLPGHQPAGATTPAPRPGARPAGPAAARSANPEATVLLDNQSLRASVEALAREQSTPAAPRPRDDRRPPSAISVRGGARTLDE